MLLLEKNKIYDVKFIYDKLDKFYTANCYAEDKNKSLGYLTFKVTANKQIFAYRIETTSELGKGVGSALIDALEYFALVNNIDIFDSKYYPTNKYAKDFYEHRGYEIYKDGFQTYVFKRYEEEEIKENILPKIIEIPTSDKQDISLERY